MSSRLTTLAIALGVGATAWLSLAGGYPSRFSPCSLLVVLPGHLLWALVFEGHGQVVEIVGMVVAFFLPAALSSYVWLADVRRGRIALPIRSQILGGFALVTVPWYLATAWDHGVEYQGYEEAASIVTQSAAGWLLVLILGFRARFWPSSRASLFFHSALFFWLAWCAFPWLGETP